MAILFLSYTHEDKRLAVQIQQALEAQNHKVWRDDSDIQPGEPIPERVATGAALCDYFLVLLTTNAPKSKWMRRELNIYAANADNWDRIIPLKYDNTSSDEFSPILRATLDVDISGQNFEDGIRSILRRIGTSTGLETRRIEDLKRLRFAIDLAVRAGGVAMRFYNSSLLGNQPLDERKNASTRADKAANNEIVCRIRPHDDYNEDAVISEEELPHHTNDVYDYIQSRVKREGYTWVVDPLDGTSNFDNKIPFFCSAVACLRNTHPFLGVIFDPVANDVYYAMDGLPTEVWNISRGEVSRPTNTRAPLSLKNSIVGTHISGRVEVAERLFNDNLLLDISKQVRQLRAFGSGSLALAYVATGRLQAFYQLDSYLWDQAAGVVLVHNSGGEVRDMRRGGEKWSFKTRDILAASNGSTSDALSNFLIEKSAN